MTLLLTLTLAARRFLADVEHFDAALYGVSPSEAAVLDPQQRLILEVNIQDQKLYICVRIFWI